jgi:thioredoxin reductase (NADPH)
MSYDVVIIGSGPAGLTACLYCLRARLNVLLIDKAASGGYLNQIQALENYPGFEQPISGYELAEKMVSQLKQYDYKFEQLQAEKIEPSGSDWKIFTAKQEIVTKTVIIATGSTPKTLGIEGEGEFTGKGVSYCAVCDAPFFKNKELIVIGGGNTALEEAIYLTKFAARVKILHRRSQLRADKVLQERAKSNQKIEFLLNRVCIKISGTKTVENVYIEDVQTKNQELVSAQGVFIFVGMKPQTEFLGDLVRRNESGYILTDKDLLTSQKGIFVCGDCRDIPLRQVITACGEGAIAAYSARKYLE